ncbi:MAG: hypothetical protein K0U64_07250 [Actinomycetia bacterium]|nr:hypothetical protein [Actinomycetes bacterium]
MSEQAQDRPRGIQRLLEDFQTAALAPLNAIPEIRDSETLRRAAEQVQQSQRDLIESLKDAYPMLASDYAEKQRQKEFVAQAKADLDAAEKAARTAHLALKEACVVAVAAGVSEDSVSAMADVSSITLQRWEQEAVALAGAVIQDGVGAAEAETAAEDDAPAAPEAPDEA